MAKPYKLYYRMPECCISCGTPENFTTLAISEIKETACMKLRCNNCGTEMLARPTRRLTVEIKQSKEELNTQLDMACHWIAKLSALQGRRSTTRQVRKHLQDEYELHYRGTEDDG